MRQTPTITCLYIDFDCFFASVEQQFNPKLQNRPMGVLPVGSLYSGFIAVSREAKALGIKRGARLVDVREVYPDFAAVVARHDFYVQIHLRILDIVSQSLPIHKIWSIDEVECRLMGNERMNWHDLAGEIRANLVAQLGPYITPSIGFAANQLLAKIAAEMDKPNGLVCLYPEKMPDAIYGIDLSDIPGVGRAMKARLEAAGIGSVRQLMGLGGKQMRALWRSVEGERMWANLHGYAVEAPATTRRMFGHGRVLSPDWRNRAGVRNCARLLLVKAARRLRRMGFAAAAMSLSVEFSNKGFGDKVRRQICCSFPVPAIDDKTFLCGLDELLAEVWRASPANPPFKASVCLFSLVAVNARSEDLLETKAERTDRRRWEDISIMIDEVNRKYARTMICLGTYIEPPGGYAGGKIAFGRIPDQADFI